MSLPLPRPLSCPHVNRHPRHEPGQDVLRPAARRGRLTALDCEGSWPGKGRLADLSPLKGLPLTPVSRSYTRVANLSALRGKKQTKVHFAYCAVADLAP